jgi:hypothetical protein
MVDQAFALVRSGEEVLGPPYIANREHLRRYMIDGPAQPGDLWHAVAGERPWLTKPGPVHAV